MANNPNITPVDFAGIYKEIAEVIGIEATILLHDNFQGQQITFPKKLFTKKHIIQQVKQSGSNADIKIVASQYGYTERRLRQMMKEQEHIKIT
ncbi:MAG: Mor transcription activator family protein [Lachnospiraceae bacterium]